MIIRIGDYGKNSGVFCCFLPRPRPTAVFGSKAAGNSFGTNGMNQEPLKLSVAPGLQTAEKKKACVSVFSTQQPETQWTSSAVRRLLVPQTKALHGWC